MEELYVIGTGNAMVTTCYNTCFALRKGEEYFLVDCGGGNTIMKKLQKTLPFFLLCCYNICGGVRDDAVLTASEKL